MAKAKSLDLRVVLDTNALYTGSASYFVRKEVADLIAQHKDLPDLRISWHLPSVVRDERNFQMITEAQKFLEPIRKLERLLGHNLNITPDILETRVREAIEKQITEHGLSIMPFDSTAVDWTRMITDAVFRRAPFQVGEREKGFRDAIILESFLQLREASPSSRTSCRLALVSGDDLLRSAAAARLDAVSNVHILDSIEALKGLINTLGSAVDEQFIGLLLPKADKLFYTPGDETTLYYRWKIADQLKATLDAASISLPAGAGKYNLDKWIIRKPRFLKKQGQRVSWVSRLGARLRAVKLVEYSTWQQPTKVILPSASEQSLIIGTSQPSTFTHGSSLSSGGLTYTQPTEGSPFFTAGLLSFPEEQPVATGTASIDVTWTVSVTTALNFKSPHLDGLAFVDTIWE